MATKRPKPFVWVSWLAQLMTGDNPCAWQAWFKAHHTYDKLPSDFDLVGWTIDHNKMLLELTKRLSEKGKKCLIEFELAYPLEGGGAKIKGKADCVAIDGDAVAVYDCKTGRERSSDQAQVMIYMYVLGRQPEFREKQIRGVVAYTNREQEIPKLPDTFEANLIYFFDQLCQDDPLPKAPGSACKFCDIGKDDCPERND